MKRHALMNRHLVWGRIWVAVVEDAKGRHQSIAALVFALAVPSAFAAPTGGQISAGSGAIIQAGTTTTITQQSQNLAINWQSFGIAANEAVRFNQPDASAIALNRILGQNPSQILGSLSANGQVFVLNPNGVLFGTSAQVDVGGLVASTLGMGDTDFMAGNNAFTGGSSTGPVVNQGILTAADGGYIALIAPEVRNEGIITATMGTALLAAGDKVTLNLNHGSLISYSIDQGSLNALAENSQLIQADGGQVFMSANAANALSTAVVNNTGIIEARTIQDQGGVIKLLGDMQTGQVNVGGTLDASAPDGGDGGFIETSAAHVKVADTAQVSTAAPAGETGAWLIDPNDYTIAATGGDITGATLATNLATTSVTIASADGATPGNGDIFVNDTVTWNSANSLTLNAIRHVQVNQAITNSGSGSVNLRADSAGACVAGAASCGTVSFTAPGAVTAITNIYYNPTGSNNAADANGVGPSYATPTSYTGNVTGTLNAYMLINDVNQLQAMSTNRTGKYALGIDIDATATSGWNSLAGFVPVGTNGTQFAGTLDGLSHTISNLFINRPTTDYVGLFGMTGAGNVRNVGLLGGSVSGRANVGMLVGYNNVSAISNSYATGSVSGSGNSVGGLVGLNRKTITTSYATGNVSSGADYAGGLVGYNNGFASNITGSYATGSVTCSGTGGVVGVAGGLVGQNNGTISKSYSTGSVTSNALAGVGGLVGYSFGSVSNSFWDTQSSGKATSGAGRGMATADMMTQANFTSATAANGNVNPAWDFTNTWWMSDTNTRPFLRMEYGTTVKNAHQLQLMSMNLGANYTLANNIGMGELAQASGMWNTTNGFVPVGNSTTPFTGTFDGLNYSISNLLVYLPATNYVGLFGYTSAASISNVSVAGNVTGYDYVGGLVGKTNNSSTISNVTSTVSVTGHAQVGGIVGWNDPSTLTNVVASGNVTGVANVGGIVGWNDASVIDGASFSGVVSGSDGVGGLAGNNTGASNINKIFAGGNVNGSTNTGGVIGSNDSNSISNGLWDTDTSGLANAIGGGSVTSTDGLTGLTLEQTHQQASYPGWDFVNTWRIYEGHTVPLLKSLLTPLTITADNVNKVYDGTSVGLTGVVYSDPDAAGSSNLFGVATPYGAVSKNNVGMYAADIWSNQQGYDITLVGGQLTVTPAPLTITANNASKIYDSLAYSGGNGVSYSGLVNGETSAELGGALAYGGSAQGAINAGNYLITPGGLTSDNYAITYADGALTVGKAALTLSGLSGTDRTYDGSTVDALTGTAMLSGLVNGETLLLGNTGNGTLASANAGSRAVTTAVTISDGTGLASNYSLTQSTLGNVTIAPAPLTVSANADSKTYDGQAYSGGNGVAYSGLVNGETSAVLGGALAYGGSAQGAINAGSYLITPGGLASGNYAISYVDGALTVSTAPLTITANDASKIYDGLTYSGGNGVTYSGLVNGETSVVLGGALAYGGSSQGATNVGSYVITPGGLTSGNYAITYADGALTVGKAPLTLSGLSGTDRPYNGSTVDALTGTAMLSGLVNGETLVLGNTGNGTLAGANAGSQAITTAVTISDGTGLASNYNLTQPTLGNVTIAPAALTVSANADSKTYDGQAYSGGNGVSYSGLVNGETSAVLGGALAYGGSAQGAINAGSYAITPGGLTSGNYAISYVDGALTVSAAPLAITANNASKIYDGLAYSGGNGVSYSGLVNGETSAVLGGALAYGGSAQGAINAGSYLITPGGLTSGNYAISYVDGALTVSAAPLTVTANDASKIYDGLTYSGGNGVTYSGLVNGETSVVLGGALAYGGSSQGATNVGSYVITPGGLTSGNYAITYADGALTVGKAALTLSGLSGTDRLYNGSTVDALTGTAMLSGLVNGETLVLGNTGNGTLASANAGSQAITTAVTISDGTGLASNYNLTQPTLGNVTIAPAALTVSANADSKTYDGQAYSGGNGVAYSGLVNGETAAVLGGALAYGGSAQGAINAGSYLITPSGLSSGNYAISYVDGTLTVNKAPLTLSGLHGTNRTYNGSTVDALTGTAMLSGLVNGETLLLGNTGNGTLAGANAGSQAVTTAVTISNGTGLASNYSLTQPTLGNVTITPAALSVSANADSKTYDGLAYSGGNGVAYSGLVNGETSAVLGGALAYGGSAQGAINAGSYLITPGGLTSGNYAISYVDGALTVNSAPLTVTANNAMKVYDGLAYSGGNGVAYSGLVNGETSAVLGGALAYAGSAQGAINAGSYVITPGGLTSDNYAISYANGELTVNYGSPAQAAATSGGASLLPAYDAAVVAVTAPAPMVVALNTLPATMPASTPGQPGDNDDGEPAAPSRLRSAATGFNTNSHGTVEQIGGLLLVNGGIRLPELEFE